MEIFLLREKSNFVLKLVISKWGGKRGGQTYTDIGSDGTVVGKEPWEESFMRGQNWLRLDWI